MYCVYCFREEVEQEKYKNVIDKFHARLKDHFTDIVRTGFDWENSVFCKCYGGN